MQDELIQNNTQNPFEAIQNRFNGLEDRLSELFKLVSVTQVPSPQRTEHQEEYCLIEEAAKILKTTPGNIRVKVCKKQIKSYKKGRRLLFKYSEIQDYIESGAKPTNDQAAINIEDALVLPRAQAKSSK